MQRVPVMQVAVEMVAAGLQEFQDHFQAPVSVSAYNRDLAAAMSGEGTRPEHDMRGHDALRDACAFLLLASDTLVDLAGQEAVCRLLYNEVGLSLIKLLPDPPYLIHCQSHRSPGCLLCDAGLALSPKPLPYLQCTLVQTPSGLAAETADK